MEFIPIDRSPGKDPYPVTVDHIQALCQRAFGPGVQVVSAQELSGGTFNRAFLITLPDRQVILRIAPPPTADVAWHEQQLMRCEHHRRSRVKHRRYARCRPGLLGRSADGLDHVRAGKIGLARDPATP